MVVLFPYKILQITLLLHIIALFLVYLQSDKRVPNSLWVSNVNTDRSELESNIPDAVHPCSQGMGLPPLILLL